MLLDKVDLKLLYLLDKNARTSYNTIGRQLGISKQAVKKRLEHLVSKGIIKYFMTTLDLSCNGMILSQIFIALQNSSNEKKKEIVSYLKNNNKILQVAVCEGTFDIFFGIFGTTNSEIDIELSKFTTAYSGEIKEKKIIFFLETRLYTRDYLINEKRALNIINKGFHYRNNKLFPINKLEMDILKCLAEDTRMSFTKISEELKTSVQNISNKVHYLEDNKIICGYNYLLNEKIFLQYLILLQLGKLDQRLEHSIFSFLETHPNVIFVVRSMGEYDFEIILECRDLAVYISFVEEFKQLFGKDITGFIPLHVTDFCKLNFNPKP
ncbi:Lrp/AsnC family transcriptional regulator [Candidatus Woesearchaeota archaeon]|nr:Lrp/AsnC family transcriptional regulator [Candidatus Woesearchaeota archaeon]